MAAKRKSLFSLHVPTSAGVVLLLVIVIPVIIIFLYLKMGQNGDMTGLFGSGFQNPFPAPESYKNPFMEGPSSGYTNPFGK